MYKEGTTQWSPGRAAGGRYRSPDNAEPDMIDHTLIHRKVEVAWRTRGSTCMYLTLRTNMRADHLHKFTLYYMFAGRGILEISLRLLRLHARR